MGFSLDMHGNILVFIVVVVMFSATTDGVIQAGNFLGDFEPTFGDHRVKAAGGQLLSLSLDKYSGAGFRSKKDYLFGRVDMQMKLVPGDSSGTVTTFYLTSDQSTGRHDEIDFEFLGNLSGQPYTVHTNVFSLGKGDREQQFHLWFDPTSNFHTYSIVWNTRLIMFLIDNTPIRVFRSNEDIGVPFPKEQPMKIQCSLWSADWATQGGLVKTDWNKAPFVAYYRNYNIDGCEGMSGKSACASSPGSWRSHDLDAISRRRLRWVQINYMIYNYCKDTKRYPNGFPKECLRSE